MPETITDSPPVQKVDPQSIPKPPESRVVNPSTVAPKPDSKPEKALFNEMASKLDQLLKGKPDVVKPTETLKPDEKATQVKEDGKDTEQFTPKKAEDWRKLHARIKEIESKSGNLEKELSAKVAEIEALKKEPR